MMRILHLSILIFALPSLISSFILVYDLASIPLQSFEKAEIIDMKYRKKTGRYSITNHYILIQTENGQTTKAGVSQDFYSMSYERNTIEVRLTAISKSLISISLLEENDIIRHEKEYDIYFMIPIALLLLLPLYSLLKLHRKNFYEADFLIKIIGIEILGTIILIEVLSSAGLILF